MSQAQVCGWLESIKFTDCIESFRKAEVEGAHLKDLDKESLAEIGLKPMQRVKVLAAIRKLIEEGGCLPAAPAAEVILLSFFI